MKNKQLNKMLVGKTGKDLLRLMGGKNMPAQQQDMIAPAGATETALFQFWRGLLGHKVFGVNDDFFHLGGNSLKAIQLVSIISREFLVDIQLADIFFNPTIAKLARLIYLQQTAQPTQFKIEPAVRPENIPLSFSQERLWLIDRLEGSLPYHVPAVLKLKGKPGIDSLAYALQQVVNRHEALRTIFTEKEGHVYQSFTGKDKWKLDVVDGSKYKDDTKGLQKYIQQLIGKPFNLSTDSLLRAAIISLNDTDHLLVVTLHHIVSDAWSLSVLINEFMELYNAHTEGRSMQLVPLTLQYADYSLWQKQHLKDDLLYKNLQYWKAKLEGIAPQQLPVDFERPFNRTNRGASADFFISKLLLNKLNVLSQEEGVTLFILLLAVFKVLLHRYSGQQDICVGTSVANRTRPEVEGLIGFFVNTLALRSNVTGDESFKTFLQQVKCNTQEAYGNQELPFEKVVEGVMKHRNSGRSPLFQAMLVMPNTPDVRQLRLVDMEISLEPFLHNTAKFDITFFIAETPNGLQGTVEYSTDLYLSATIERMTAHFETLLNSVVNNPQQKIGYLPMLTKVEMHQLLEQFNNSEVNYPRDKTIKSLFEEQAEKTPDATALVFSNNQLSYKQVNEQANQLAHYLRGRGIKEESLVPIFMERGLSMIVAILGVLKAGAAYVPIDPEFPVARIGYMLEDTGSKILLCNSERLANIAFELDADIIQMEDAQLGMQLQPTANLSINPAPSNAAYIIYTSGSTGTPKGVIITHGNLVDYVFGLNKILPVNDCTSFALVSTIATDLGNTVIYASLLSGGALHLFSKQTTTNVETLHQYFTHHQIDCLKIVPSHWKALCMDDELLLPAKLLIFGGEPLFKEMVEKIQAANSSCKIVNHYGPTETTIGKLLHLVQPGVFYGITIPIGKAFSNTNIYVLSNHMQLCPYGVAGQLYIAGDGVARGYFNKPGITNEKFLADPFANEKGSRMYATGDMVKYLADGNIEFIGRVDDQVKIRGYRIELGEIEAIISQCDRVSQAVIVAREDKQGNKRLLAYIVPEGNYEKDEITTWLKEKLPEYMVPALLVELKNLPLTANGKIDRQALPESETAEMKTIEYAPPVNDAEKALAKIWQELLDVREVGIHDNFFELGGDSIITIQLVSRARRAGYELQMGDVFTYQTIARLSALLSERSDTSATNYGEQFLLEGASGLLPIQQWYFQKQPEEISHFNQSLLLTIDKAITAPLLKRAVEQLTSYHDALRFKYYKKEGNWFQVYEHQNEVNRVITEDFQSVAAGDALAKVITENCDRYQRSLQIEKGDLLRVVLMQTPAADPANRLLIVVHHLAIDGVSWRILIDDLELLLNGLKNGGLTDLGKKTSSYRQWYQALEKYSQSEKLLSQKKYWGYVVKNYQSLPVDKEYPLSVKIKDTRFFTLGLGAAQTHQLIHDVSGAYNTEITDILIAALAKTITGFGNTDKVVIGMEGHGREPIEEGIDTSRTIGWFTTHYPVLLTINKDKTDDGLIKSIKEQLRQVPGKGLGFGVLKYINKEETCQGKNCWDIIFNYLGQPDNVLNTSQWFKIAPISAGAERSPEYIMDDKLAINSIIQAGELVINCTYSNKHYHAETVMELVQKFKHNLETLITHCVGQLTQSPSIFTPSDYGLGAEITYPELDIFLNEPYNGIARRQSLENMYPLSGMQQGMFFHGLYEEGGAGYINHFLCDLIDPRVDVLEKSWNQVFQSHTILRSAFYYDVFSVAVQAVYKDIKLPITIIDLRAKKEAEKLKAIGEFIVADKLTGFDFKSVPLMRVSLIRLNETRYRMLWSSHHILFDGWSRSLLMGELLKNYAMLISGNQLPPVIIDDFSEYIRYIQKIDKDEVQSYWKNYLQPLEQATLLPFIDTTAIRNKGIGLYNTVILDIDKQITGQAALFTQRHRITMNTLMQGVWSCLLHRYAKSDDIVYGVVVSGRPDDLSHVEQRVGMFINTLPLYASFKHGDLIVEWLKTIQNTQVDSRRYQYVPLSQVQAWSGIKGELFDTLMVFENYPVSKLLSSQKWSLEVENVQINEQTNYPLSVVISYVDEIKIDFSYNTTLLDEQIVKGISNHFEQVLLQMIAVNDKALVSDIELLTQKQKDSLIDRFNNTEVTYPKDKTIVDLFEFQVKKYPFNIAVVFEKQQITYRQLNERSNQLGHYLRGRGVAADVLVPICIGRGVDMIIGILGILKAGGAYVPVDPEYPFERIQFMVEDTGAKLVVCSKSTEPAIKTLKNIEAVVLDEEIAINHQSAKNLPAAISPGNLAYVIYTSGSSGKPKGVLIEHRNVVRLFNTEPALFDFNEMDVWSVFHSFCFDFSVWEMYGALFYGGRMVIVPKPVTKDVTLFAELIIAEKITILNQTPAAFYPLQDALVERVKQVQVRYVMFGGEALSPAKLQPWMQTYTNSKLINMYGITETTVHATYQPIEWQHTLDGKSIIGNPIPTLGAYILDSDQNPVPVGVEGELFIYGDGLARGYLNQPELTAQKFIKNPFSKLDGEKMYRTGDVARWLPDGNMEYLGRMDDQVKIHGFRIELGEIETVLLQNKLVKQAVVIAKDYNGNKKLAAYIIPAGVFIKQVIEDYLKKKLPGYMVPSYWIQMEAMPLTHNGKIDKKALPEPNGAELSKAEYSPPGNETEHALANIWQHLLGMEQVGIHDNFFELGGDSIITMQLVSRAKLAGYPLKVAEIYEHQTIAGLSALIATRMAMPGSASGEQLQLVGLSGLLPIQQWFFEKEQANFNHFNQSVLLGIHKSVTIDILQQAIGQLTAQHDALRFKYHQQNGMWLQQYGAYNCEVIYEDFRLIEPGQISVSITSRADFYQRSLNIYKGELIKVVWMQTPQTETYNRLLIIIHHLAVDGVSWRILLEGLEQLIEGASTDLKTNLGNKTSSCRQWYHALENYGDSSSLLSQLPYWQQSIKKYNPLRVDKTYTGSVRIKDRQRVVVKLDEIQTRRLLQDVPKVYHTEINDILLAALAQTLCGWSDSNAIMIGLEGHGRENIDAAIDINQTVGWFTSLYPVLLEVETNMGQADLIKTVKEQLRLIPGKGLGYGVFKYIKKETSLQGPVPWDIVFNYLGQLDNAIKDSQWLKQAEESAGASVNDEYTVDEKLTINGFVQDGALSLNWSYSNLHFNEATIPSLAADYIGNLQKIINHCAQQQSLGICVFTPSDFELGPEISYRELDRFLAATLINGKPKGQLVESIYPLSGLQQGMLFHGLYDDASGAYIVQFSCDLIGADLEIFKESWKSVMGKHSILRTAFYPDELNIPVQCVYSEASLPVEILDYRGMDNAQQQEAIKEYQQQDRVKGFDFKVAPLMRIGLIQTADNRYRMLWTSHHILFDGWSLPVLMEGFLTAYQLLAEGKQVPIVQCDRYEDYIRYLASHDKEAEKLYWKKYLHGVETSSLLPFVETTTERDKGLGEYKSLPLQFDNATTAEINRFAQACRITANTIIQGVWSFLLHGYTGSDHIVFGVTVAGRPDDLADVEQRVGMFINTVPLRSVMQPLQSVGAWLKELQGEQVSSREYQYTPLQEIQGWTGIHGSLFDTIIVFENYPVSKVIASRQWDLQVENIETTEQTNYPLSIIVSSADEINIRFSYNSRLLKEEYVQEIAGHFENVLLQVISNAQAVVGDITLITAAEENKLLVGFNDTKADYPAGENIVCLFQKQAAIAPENIALVFDGGQFTYQQLNERSNQLAHFLKSKGVIEETLIPICIERSPSLIVAILGILKAGAAYVPIDPAYPEERIAYMLEDTAAAIVISSKAGRAKITASLPISIIDIESDWLTINQQLVTNLSLPVADHQLAYIIYTSGSTGKPKGVMLEHGNLYSFICWCRHEFSSSRFNIVYATTSVCFDLSVFEIFYPLSIGKPVRILENGLHIAKYLPYDTHVLINTVPVVIQHLLQEETDMGNISVMNMAGEPIPLYVQQRLDTENMEVRNLYGPTEDTTYSTIFRLMKNKPVLIGKPIANTQIQIVNNNGALVPIGIPGEIYLTGAGVARGYLNRLELTSEKFIKDVFNNVADARLYKTGDIGRWLPDGNIEYLGRMDCQVKVRGYRIELGEIETALLQSGMVSKAVVLAKADAQGNKMLVGYVVAEGVFNKEALTTWLYGKLPEHMVPSIWVSLQSLPLTPNGKIDRNALPDPADGGELINKYIAPRNEIETALAGIWEKLLGKEMIGMDDNFFELGGDSILTIQVVSRTRRIGYELQPKDIFIHQTIARLSKAIEDRAAALILGEQDLLTGFSGLIPIQQWWLQQQQPSRSHFNQTIILGIDKNISASELNNVFGMLMEHHDALRFKYTQQQDSLWLQEYGSYKGAFITENLQAITPGLLSSTITQKASIYQRSLDITNGEIIRMVLMKLPATEINNRLLIVVHHLAIDGVSWRVLLEDMELLLNGIKEGAKTSLGPKSSSYRQWYHALENYGHGKVLLSQLPYWQQAVNSYQPLPADKEFKGLIPVKETANIMAQLDPEQTTLLLQDVPRVYHTGINDILLAALASTLAAWCQTNSVMIGLEGHGREGINKETDTNRTVGWFTSLYPLQLKVPINRGTDELIKSVKEQLRQVPDKGLGYGVLKFINHEPTLQGADPWDIVFNYLGQLDNAVKESKWFSPVKESTGAGRSKEQFISEKISINALVQDGKLLINWSYSRLHYEEITITKLAEEYSTILQQLIAHCMMRQKSGLVYTPSDYGLGADVSYEELDQFLEEDDNDNILSF